MLRFLLFTFTTGLFMYTHAGSFQLSGVVEDRGFFSSESQKGVVFVPHEGTQLNVFIAPIKKKPSNHNSRMPQSDDVLESYETKKTKWLKLSKKEIIDAPSYVRVEAP